MQIQRGAVGDQKGTEQRTCPHRASGNGSLDTSMEWCEDYAWIVRCWMENEISLPPVESLKGTLSYLVISSCEWPRSDCNTSSLTYGKDGAILPIFCIF